MRRVTGILAAAALAWLLGGGQAKAKSPSYGFLYNGTSYTTLAVPGAMNSTQQASPAVAS